MFVRVASAGLCALLLVAMASCAQTPAYPIYEPEYSQPGKDVVWVPTPLIVVETMLDLAKVTPEDYVIDLGSGDGRLVIGAAKRGARALGIEYDDNLVRYSIRDAQKAGVSDKAQFVQADIFATDFSKATVLTLFLLPEMNLRLRPQFLAMKPGTRISSHQFTMEDWEPDEVSDFDWRRAYHWIVPAKVQGAWTLEVAGSRYEVELTQKFQKIEGTVRMDKLKAGLREPKLRGDRIWFAFIDQQGVKRDFEGTVAGGRIEGAFRPDSGAEGRFSASKK